MATQILTTEDKIAARLSQIGINLRIDHMPTGAGNALDEAILAASAEVEMFLQRYQYTDMATSDWVVSVATDFAIVYLCRWRNNPVPKVMEDAMERHTKMLERVLDGKMGIPGLSAGKTYPGIRTQRVMNAGPQPTLRVVENASTIKTIEGFPQYTDPTEPPPR